jgi:hypothetical protein
MRKFLVAIGVAMTAGAVLCGCSFSASVGGVTVAAADLQKDISSKLENSGQKPQSVTCHGDLKGEVGATTDCEIVLTEANTFEGHVKATKVDGTTVSYETSPALTKEQLEKQVSNFVTDQNKLDVSSVTCQSGLDGVEGKTADCKVDLGSGDVRQTVVTMTSVNGLLMNFDIKEV